MYISNVSISPLSLVATGGMKMKKRNKENMIHRIKNSLSLLQPWAQFQRTSDCLELEELISMFARKVRLIKDPQYMDACSVQLIDKY